MTDFFFLFCLKTIVGEFYGKFMPVKKHNEGLIIKDPFVCMCVCVCVCVCVWMKQMLRVEHKVCVFLSI